MRALALRIAFARPSMIFASRPRALLVLLLVALPVAFLAFRQGALRVDADNGSMKSIGSPAALAMERRVREFGEDHFVLLGFELESGDEWKSHAEDLTALTRDLHSLGGVGRVLPVDWFSADLRVLAVEVEGDERGGGYAASVERVARLAERVERAGLRLHVTGQPAAEVAIARAVDEEQSRVVPLIVAGLLLVLLAAYRHLGVAVAALLPAGLGIAATGGIFALLGEELNPISSLLRPVILSVGVAGAVHLVEGYRARRARGMAPERAAEATTRDLLVPALLTAGTTAAGFLALLTNAIPAAARFGLFAALGVGITSAFTLLVTPALLVLLARGELGGRTATGVASAAERFTRFVAGRRRWILAAAGVLAAASALSCLRISADTDPLRLLPEDHELRRATEVVSARLGGVETFDVLVPAGSELAEPGRLRELTRSLLARPAVARQAGPVRESAEGTRLLTLLLAPGGTKEREALFAELEAEWGGADGKALLVTGTSVQVAQDSGALVRGQLKSLGITLVVLFGVISASFRSWRAGLLGMMPNLLPCLVLYGGITALGRPLSVATAMIGSVMLGLVVDDTIHFLYRHHGALRRGAPAAVAVAAALRHAGRPIVITSLVLGLGFALGLAGTLATTREFGLFAAATVVLALVADLLVLPALLLRGEPRRLEAAEPLPTEGAEVSVA